VVCLLLVSVSVVLIAPQVDLAPTTMRAWHAARLVLAVLAAAATQLAGFRIAASSSLRQDPGALPRFAPDLVERGCSRLLIRRPADFTPGNLPLPAGPSA